MGSELCYYHQDEQLSAALLTDDTGRIRNYYRYDAFGGMLAGESRIGESNVPIGYYQDSNGIWRRANISSGTHGNSLSDTRTNYGYALLDKDTKDILKFWESIASESCYTQKYLDSNNAEMMILDKGTKLDMYLWQHDMNMYYKNKYKEFPKLNNGGW